MGAIFCEVSFEPCSEKNLREKFSNYKSKLLQENGDDIYSGHLGLKSSLEVSGRVFEDYDSAVSYIENKSDKWGPAIAVKVGDFKLSFPKTKKEIAEVQKFELLNEKISNWNNNILTKLHKGKSQYRGCSGCGSKIAVKYITTTHCPICLSKNFIETEREMAQYKKLLETVSLQKKKVAELKSKFNGGKKQDIYWLIAGWTPS